MQKNAYKHWSLGCWLAVQDTKPNSYFDNKGKEGNTAILFIKQIAKFEVKIISPFCLETI